MQFRKFAIPCAVLIAAMPLFAQQPAAAQQPMPTPPGHSMQDGQMPADCQAMMAKMERMHAAQAAMDERLAALVAEMNKARGSAKVDRMAAVINEMVAQRKQMRDEMAAMMPRMMSHMMQHMQDGMTSAAHSMSNCPMMSNAGEKAQAAPPEHKH